MRWSAVVVVAAVVLIGGLAVWASQGETFQYIPCHGPTSRCLEAP
jgi:hypothetical protein